MTHRWLMFCAVPPRMISCKCISQPLYTAACSRLYKDLTLRFHQLATATAPNNQPRSKLQSDINKLLDTDKTIPTEDFTLYVKHANQAINIHKLAQVKELSPAVRKRIAGSRILTVKQPTSVEDYLLASPEPVKELPPISALPGIYAGLSKSRLTALVVLTAMGGYAMAPGAFDLNTLLLLSAGTTLQSAAANATNQTMEVKYDSQMYRTRNRVLVRGLISREHAASFAAVSGVLGTGILYFGVNPLTCSLGMLNYFLYTAVYTPMKRRSVTNTWAGAIVGAIPPMMGWAAATNCMDIGALWLGAILYIWQFPHFKALSWNIRHDYQRAGYVMSSVTNPEMCKQVAFRHTLFMTAVCCLGPQVGVTTDMFILYSLPINIFGSYLGWRFYRDGDSNSSRKLFRFSLIQIPYLIIFMLISKNWRREKEHVNNTSQVLPTSELVRS